MISDSRIPAAWFIIQSIEDITHQEMLEEEVEEFETIANNLREELTETHLQ